MTTNSNSAIALTAIICILTACRNANKQTTEHSIPGITDTISGVVTAYQPAADTINYDLAIYPVDTLLQTKVLTTGSFHNDEVWPGASNEKWFGLFKGRAGFYMASTPVHTKRVHDPVMDEEESETTGWKVSIPNKDSNYILVEALPFLTNKTVISAPLTEKYIYPGETLTFAYLGVEYTLFATGGKKKVQNDPEAYDVWNYKLYVTANVGGQQKTQLLVAQPTFDDHMIEVLFAGDIDGDNILDLIIDTSRHYNMLSPTLYLSRPAEKEQIAKPVGAHVIVGC